MVPAELGGIDATTSRIFPGLSMRRVADLYLGQAKTDARDAFIIADAARTMPHTQASASSRPRSSPARGSYPMPTALIVEFVATHRDEHGVDPICAPLRGTAVQIAPSTVRAHLSPRRVAAPRVIRDRTVPGEIRVIHADNLGVYGA